MTMENMTMKRLYYDAIYLMACGVNRRAPSPECLRRYEDPEEALQLYRFCRSHFLEALVGTTLQKGGVTLPEEWKQAVAKTVRRELLFDAEREKILKYLDTQGIWYLPLKGIVLKQYYPATGMRQMSDNDILIDSTCAGQVMEYMVAQGYEASVGHGNHDVYEKPPVYNFEMHRSLYGAVHDPRWQEYYRDIRSKLCKVKGTACGYRMRDEDFYVYIVCHAYKHYRESGTGIRSLLDFYVYLSQKENAMDFVYIERECAKLGIAEFEKGNRILCRKVFAPSVAEHYENSSEETFVRSLSLSEEEQEMLYYYLTSGTYGTLERKVENRMAEYRGRDGSPSKALYYWRRIFPEPERYLYICPLAYRHRWLLPAAWVYRLVRMIVVGERRRKILRELRILKKKTQKPE